MDNREALEQQLKDLEAQKVTLFDSGSADQVEVGRLNEQIKGIRQQLSEIQSHETIIATAEEITSSMETFTVGDTEFTLYDLTKDEDCAKILRKGLETISKAQASKFLSEISAQKGVYEAQLNAKQEQIGNLVANRDELQETNSQLRLERDDLEEKRDAAGRQLAELNVEIARLNSHVDDLRKEIANGSPQNNIIDITSDADLEAAAQRLKAKKEADAEAKKEADKAARVRIYGVQQLDGTGAKFGAYRAEDDVYILFGWLEKNKFIELSAEEVTRFREELEAAKQAELESTPEAEIVAEPVGDFRTELDPPELQNVDATNGLDENTTEGQDGQDVAGGVVTREEFEELKALVYNHELFLSMKSERG